MVSITFVMACNNNITTTIEQTTNTASVTSTTNESNLEVLNDTYFQYSTNSTQNLLILNLDITDDVIVYDLDENPLNKDDILVKNEYYEIKSSYVLSQEAEKVEFYLEFSNKINLVSISGAHRVYSPEGCVNCGQCLINCPYNAIEEKVSFIEDVWKAIKDPNKIVVAMPVNWISRKIIL